MIESEDKSAGRKNLRHIARVRHCILNSPIQISIQLLDTTNSASRVNKYSSSTEIQDYLIFHPSDAIPNKNKGHAITNSAYTTIAQLHRKPQAHTAAASSSFSVYSVDRVPRPRRWTSYPLLPRIQGSSSRSRSAQVQFHLRDCARRLAPIDQV